MNPQTSSARLFRRLVHECLHFPVRLVVTVVSLLALAATRLVLTWVVKLWVEGPLAQGDAVSAGGLLTAAVVLTVVMAGAVFVSRYQLAAVNQRVIQGLRNTVQQRVLAMEVGTVRTMPSGEVASRVFNDIGALSGFVSDILKRLIGEGAVLVGAIAMMFYLEWRSAAVTVFLVPLVAILLDRLGRYIRSRSSRAQRNLGILSATLNEQLLGLTTIKNYQAEGRERARFAEHNVRYRDQVMHSEWWAALLLTLVFAITGTGLVGVVWYGTRQVAGGSVGPGGLLAFCLYAVQTIEPLRRLGDLQGMLQRALAAAARVYELIDAPQIERGGSVRLPTPVRGALRVEAVDFYYRTGEPVLNDLSLQVGAGETVALVSATGEGKSTLARLLVRFHEPSAGRILLDSIDIRTLDLADLRRAVCVVEQDPFIFSGPLIDNLLYGSWDASRAAVDGAVERAGLEPLVRSLPGGLSGGLAEVGGDLSGGQKQRIALARAVLRDPAVLVLDEATSALDSDSEAGIFARLENWLAQRTVLVIAHRLSTVSRFRRVVVLERGGVVGDGNVLALRRSCPTFLRLFAEQLELLRDPNQRPLILQPRERW